MYAKICSAHTQPSVYTHSTTEYCADNQGTSYNTGAFANGKKRNFTVPNVAQMGLPDRWLNGSSSALLAPAEKGAAAAW